MIIGYRTRREGFIRLRIPVAVACVTLAFLLAGSGGSCAAPPAEPAGLRADMADRNRTPHDQAALRAEKGMRIDETAARRNEEINARRQGAATDGGRLIHIFNLVVGVVLAAVMVICLIYLVRKKR